MEFRIPSGDAVQQNCMPKMRSTKPNNQDAALIDPNADWKTTVDPNTLKEFSSLSRLQTHVSLKLERVQSALAAAKDPVSLPRLRTYLKNIEDAYAEFCAVHSKVITTVPDTALQRQKEVFADFEDRYNVVRTTIEDLTVAQGKSPARGPNPQQQPFNDPIRAVDEYRADWTKLYFLAPVVQEKPKKMNCENPQDNHEVANHVQPRSHLIEHTIRKSSDPHPKHFKTTLEDFNRQRQYQTQDSSPSVKGKHDTQTDPNDQRTGHRSNIRQTANSANTLQSPSNNSPEQRQFQSNELDFYQYDRQEYAPTSSHQVPDTSHSTIDRPTSPTIEQHTIRKIPTDSKETIPSRQDDNNKFCSSNPVQYSPSKSDATEFRLIRPRFRPPKRMTMENHKPETILLNLRVNRGEYVPYGTCRKHVRFKIHPSAAPYTTHPADASVVESSHSERMNSVSYRMIS